VTATLAGIDLTFGYGGRDVLRGATAAARAGRVTAVVGPSGSGKTTLLWLMAGLLVPKSGRVVLAESPDAAQASGKPVDFGRLRLGMVFQSSALWEHLTAEEHLRLVLAGKGLGRGERRRRTEEALARLNLAALRRRRPGELSGGERRRLAVARAVAADPEWLLLDEPLVHLDGPAREELFALLRGLLADTRAAQPAGRQAGVLLATHDAAEAMRLADEIVVLLDGAVAQAGPPEEVYRRPASLVVARMLGPAGELAGEAAAGVLSCGGRPALEGLPPEDAGPRRIILRPEDVRFQADGAGPASVRRCEFQGDTYLLMVECCGSDVLVRHPHAVAPGATGRLALRPASEPRP